MGIRIPGKPNVGVSELRHKNSDSLKAITRVLKSSTAHEVVLVWEQTSFVDKYGKAFYDKYGIPFQGKR